MAYYRKLPSGKHQFTVRHPSGRRVSKTFDLKGMGKVWANELEVEFRSGGSAASDPSARKLTVDQWHDKWKRSRNVEPGTAKKNESHWRNHVQPYWGNWPLRTIDRIDVQTWVTQMTKDKVGADTITASYHLLSKMLSDAVLSKKLGASPCLEIDLPTIVKPTPRWLTRHEYDRIQLALANRMQKTAGGRGAIVPDPNRATWQAFVGLGAFSGLRCPGELAGLDVEHVDFDRQMVRVEQVMTRYGMRAYPKTEGSVRSVPFPSEVADLLWRAIGDRATGPVFLAADGGRVDEANFRGRVWAAALDEAGIKYVRPYVLRHTAASWLVQAGVPPLEIVKMLGHSSMRLVNTYLHLAPDQHDRIRAAWSGKSDLTLDKVEQSSHS